MTIPPLTTPDSFADPHVAPNVYLTADIPGVGGVIKQRPEDFLVEELPLYEPSGAGEHLYLFVEKRGLSTSDMVSTLARAFRVSRGSVGFAGMKDKQAITRQMISIHLPRGGGDIAESFRHERISILWADRHANKLKRGHSRGNRFSIRIRGVEIGRAPAAHKALRRLAEIGAPNRAGEQRFGAHMNNHLVGRADIMGDAQAALDLILGPDDARPDLSDVEARRLYAQGDFAAALEALPRTCRHERMALRALVHGATPEKALNAIDETQRRFWVTAFQSAVFNRVLDERVTASALATLTPGDLAFRHANGAVFAVTDETLAPGTDTLDRLAQLEISPSGPLWGVEMRRAAGEIDRAELQAVEAAGVTLDHLTRFAHRVRQPFTGARRPLRVPLTNPDLEAGVDEHGAYIRCAFDLPAGAFATVALREIMKPKDEARLDRADAESSSPDSSPDSSADGDRDD